MKKGVLLLFALATMVFLCACGAKEVDEASIRQYLEQSVYGDGTKIESITDISTQEAGTDQNAVVSCTVTVSSEYCRQKSNYTLYFERFEKQWIGMDYSSGYGETELIAGLSEQELKSRVDLSRFDNTLVWITTTQTVTPDYTLAYSNYQCDLDNGVCSVDLCETVDYGGYSQNVYYTVSSSWNNELLEWREPELSKALYQDDYVITMDITGSYDFEARDGYHYSFEIVDEDGVPYFKNLERTYRGDNPYAKPKPFSVESALIEFKHSFGTECMVASCSSGSRSFGLSICYGSLYFVAPGWSETRIASID